MKVKIVFDEISQLVWAVRVVERSEKYGLNDALTHESDVPLVEFYDTRYGHTDLGQFVSRYSLDTLLNHEGGLCLDGGVPNWNIYGAAMTKVVTWLNANYPHTKPAEELRF